MLTEELDVDVLELMPRTRFRDVDSWRRGALHPNHAARIAGHRGHLLAARDAVEPLGGIVEADKAEEPIERLVLQHQHNDVSDLVLPGHRTNLRGETS